MKDHWNYDMSQAPRGRTETREKVRPKGAVITQADVFIPEKIIAASKCGKVTVSYWIPQSERWAMFARGEEPIAWSPWPKHPEATQ